MSGNVDSVGYFLLVVFGALVITAACPFIGMTVLDPSRLFEQGIESMIFWDIRIPRVLLSSLSGASLALAGLVLQSLFLNPLVEPYTIGIASGASLGTAIYVKTGLILTSFGPHGLSLFAFGGAITATMLVYGLSRLFRGQSMYSLLLCGVAISFFFNSLILLLQYLSDFTQSFRIIRWLLGSLEITGYEPIFDILPLFVIGVAIIVFHHRELDLMLLGEDIALSRGVDVLKTKRILFFSSSFLVGAVVAFCGPIAFVGLIVPHIVKLLFNHRHRFTIPASLVVGAAFLTVCDTFARVVIAPAEMPVGILSSFLGGPFFLLLLFKERTR